MEDARAGLLNGAEDVDGHGDDHDDDHDAAAAAAADTATAASVMSQVDAAGAPRDATGAAERVSVVTAADGGGAGAAERAPLRGTGIQGVPASSVVLIVAMAGCVTGGVLGTGDLDINVAGLVAWERGGLSGARAAGLAVGVAVLLEALVVVTALSAAAARRRDRARQGGGWHGGSQAFEAAGLGIRGASSSWRSAGSSRGASGGGGAFTGAGPGAAATGEGRAASMALISRLPGGRRGRPAGASAAGAAASASAAGAGVGAAPGSATGYVALDQ